MDARTVPGRRWWMRITTGAALVIAAVLAGGTAAVGETAESPDSATVLDQVVADGAMQVCTTGDYRPFTYLDPDTGEYSGIDVDMALAMGEDLGVDVEFVPTTWSTLMADFTGGACDIAVGGISVTTDRALEAYYSTAYLQDGKTPVTRCEDVERFQTLDQIDQPGVRVVVNPGGTNEEFVRSELTEAEIVGWPDNNTIFGQIIDGNVDLMITDATETQLQEQQHPGVLCAVHPDEPFTFSEKAYLLPRGDDVLKHWVDQWLRIALHDGTYDAFAAEWLGPEAVGNDGESGAQIPEPPAGGVATGGGPAEGSDHSVLAGLEAQGVLAAGALALLAAAAATTVALRRPAHRS